jgi:periplasmic divalent cation tolerance protein
MTEPEFLLMIKTQNRLYPLVEKVILEIHPYEIPEILKFPVHDGLTSYLAWISKSVG